MAETGVEIRVFDHHTATEREFAALNAHGNRMRAESWPDDPPNSVEETIRNLRSVPPFVEFCLWAAWREGGSEIAATARAFLSRTEDNRHAAGFGIGVLPERRGRGIGRRLLEEVAGVAREDGRRLLITDTDADVPAGAAFMNRLGARAGLASHIKQLDLQDLNRELLRQWQERARERAAGFELGLWEGPYPEEALADVAAMKQAINLAPRGDLEVEDWHWTPERLCQEDASMLERKIERWTCYVRESATGKIAGYTETYWSAERSHILSQGDTAVFPDYRNRGLGRWLKAAMLEKVLRDRPQVKIIRTGNADSNAAMLGINTELGFKPYKAWTTWQVELDRVLDYLGTSHHREHGENRGGRTWER